MKIDKRRESDASQQMIFMRQNMQAVMSFNEVLEAVDHLSLTEQESLIDILRRLWLKSGEQN